MELLDRYLEAVRKHLPWKRQNDILAELRANLEARLEDREAELGRALTKEEAEGWLREIGPPMQMAARYQPQQYLIGPRLFPAYLTVLRTALPWLLILYAVVCVFQLVAGSGRLVWVFDILVHLPVSLLITVGVITGIFAVIEFAGLHFPERFPTLANRVEEWSPARLPAVTASGCGGKKPRSFAAAVTQVVFGALFLAWWLLVPRYPALMLGPGAEVWKESPYSCAPVLLQFYWWVVVLNGLQLLWRIVNLFSGAWRKRDSLQHRVVALLGVIPLILLVNARGTPI